MKNTNSAAESGAFIRKTRGYSVVQNEALFNDSLSMSATINKPSEKEKGQCRKFAAQQSLFFRRLAE